MLMKLRSHEARPDGNAVNDAGTTKDPDLTVLEEEEEEENEFFVDLSGSLNPVDYETDTLPTDVHMEESEPLSQEPVDVVTGTNTSTENIAAIDGKPELLRIETADDHVKTEGEVHENVDQIGAADMSGTIEEQAAFMKESERFHIERALDFKPTKFFDEPLNCLKLWRLVIILGGYDHGRWYLITCYFLNCSIFVIRTTIEHVPGNDKQVLAANRRVFPPPKDLYNYLVDIYEFL